MNKFKLIFTGVSLAILAGCATVPLTGRKQLSLVDESALQQQAAQAYSQFLSDPSTTVIRNSSDAQRVKTIGGKLATAIEKYLNANGYANQYNYNWEFNLVQSKDINAWCMPGGKVAVYSGILPVTANDAGLATVMGHEIAHAIAHHASEQASQASLAQVGGSVIGAATNSQTLYQLYGIGGQLALLKYSRNQESEADRLGLIFMSLAGYNPNEAVNFWTRMSSAKESGGAPPEFLSTHPSDATRINAIRKLVPEAMQYYNGTKKM